MQRKTRASSLVAAIAVALVLLSVPTCKRKPAATSVGSTDTIQSTPQTTGTTATETGGGKPVTTTSTTATTGTH